jgi:hypothetical protein
MMSCQPQVPRNGRREKLPTWSSATWQFSCGLCGACLLGAITWSDTNRGLIVLGALFFPLKLAYNNDLGDYDIFISNKDN